MSAVEQTFCYRFIVIEVLRDILNHAICLQNAPLKARVAETMGCQYSSSRFYTIAEICYLFRSL